MAGYKAETTYVVTGSSLRTFCFKGVQRGRSSGKYTRGKLKGSLGALVASTEDAQETEYVLWSSSRAILDVLDVFTLCEVMLISNSKNGCFQYLNIFSQIVAHLRWDFWEGVTSSHHCLHKDLALCFHSASRSSWAHFCLLMLRKAPTYCDST